jgi:predicted CopG family antitoxin
MGSKTISLDDEAYGLLKEAKQGEESFSDVVKRTLGHSRPRWGAIAGLLTSKEGAEAAETVRKLRRESARGAAGRQKRLWKGEA